MKKLIFMLIAIAVSSTAAADWQLSEDQFDNDIYIVKQETVTKPYIGSIFTIRKGKGFPKRTTTKKCRKLPKNRGYDCTKREYGRILKF